MNALRSCPWGEKINQDSGISHKGTKLSLPLKKTLPNRQLHVICSNLYSYYSILETEVRKSDHIVLIYTNHMPSTYVAELSIIGRPPLATGHLPRHFLARYNKFMKPMVHRKKNCHVLITGPLYIPLRITKLSGGWNSSNQVMLEYVVPSSSSSPGRSRLGDFLK